MSRIAFATWRGGPELTEDDRLVLKPLRGRGVRVEARPWSATGVDWTAFEAIVVRSCWDYHVRPDRFVEWLETLDSAAVTVINPVSMLRWNLDKRYLEELENGGVRVEPTVWLDRGESEDLSRLLVGEGWQDAVVKPVVSASARNTWRTTRRRATLDQERLDRLLEKGAMMVQRYNPRVETDGELSLVFVSGAFSHAVVKSPARGDFRVQPELGGASTPVEPSDRVVVAAADIIAATGFTPTYARVDGVVDRAGLVLMELELIEPSLFLATDPLAPERFADAIITTMEHR